MPVRVNQNSNFFLALSVAVWNAPNFGGRWGTSKITVGILDAGSNSFAFDKSQQKEQQDRSHECANELTDLSGGPETRQSEEKPAQQRANHAHDEIPHQA